MGAVDILSGVEDVYHVFQIEVRRHGPLHQYARELEEAVQPDQFGLQHRAGSVSREGNDLSGEPRVSERLYNTRGVVYGRGILTYPQHGESWQDGVSALESAYFLGASLAN